LTKAKYNIGDRINSATLKSPLAYGIANVDLLENKKWEVLERKWIEGVYDAINPYYLEKDPIGRAHEMCLMKPTQVGMSTMGLVKMFHFADYWDIRAIYTLPRQQDVIDLVSTRVDPMIRASERLTELLGKPDSTRVKSIGNSYVFFMELSVEPRMMPADALYIDEVDLSDQGHLGTALNRLDASNWRIINQFGTPTISNFGIDSMYKRSDMQRWMLKCESCGTWQHLEWDKHVKIVGNLDKPTDVYFGCVKCNNRFELDFIQTGKWVAEKPSITKDRVGFHISQLMNKTAFELYIHLLDPKQTLVEFWRKRLGLPYELSGGQLEREDILLNCFREHFEFEAFANPEEQYYMGVDQGNALQVMIGRYDKEKNRINVVHTEIIPPSEEDNFVRLGQLMRLYEIRKAVIDGDPNRNSVKTLRKAFPGRILLADYAKTERTWQVSAKDNDGKSVIKSKTKTNVAINRTDSFDAFIESVNEGMWGLPGGTTPIHPHIETVMSQWTKIKRDVEFKTKSDGEKVELAVYRSVGADHFAHAAGYLKTAVEIGKGTKFRARIIGQSASGGVGDKDLTVAPKRALRIR